MPLIHHLILAVCVAFSSFSGIPHPRKFPWYAIMRPYPLSHMNTHIIKADREVVCVLGLGMVGRPLLGQIR